MDFGSSSWPDSLGWLVDRYGERGVDFFDEIWAWEVTAANHTEYWSKVPAHQRHRLHVSWQGGTALMLSRARPGGPAAAAHVWHALAQCCVPWR